MRLEKAGKPVVYMTKPKEGHGFFKEDNNTERYKITEDIPGKIPRTRARRS